MKKEVWYIPVEKPSVVGWKPPGTITGNAGRFEAWTVEVLGPPVPALPAPLSPEARAVLEAAAEEVRCLSHLVNELTGRLEGDAARKAFPVLNRAIDRLRAAFAAFPEERI